MTGVYILADGRDVPNDSPLARHERQALSDHLSDLQSRRGTEARREYLEGVQASMGKAYRDRLAAMFLASWEAREVNARRYKGESDRGV
jgi:hypothetical protein